MSDEPLPADFAHMPCGGWCLGECPGCCECRKAGCSGCGTDGPALAAGGIITRLAVIGEDGPPPTVLPTRTRRPVEVHIEFDCSSEATARLCDALRRWVRP